MNKQILDKVGISHKDYIQYCKKYKKPSYLRSTKAEFFKNIQAGKIVRDVDGSLMER